ncbi:hypothetical protein [Georgenia faecalis]|uniref:hypothetical protein n=1 Tax=Georgenia faecalis TaxID=2483799 RepID=UPI000FD7CBEE|nr:hypothetical protein [Georgenia faecalis]
MNLALQGIDWGSVPAWFSAGSLILAWYVILRERREKRADQASRISAWVRTDPDDGSGKVCVRNGSTEMITFVRVVVTPRVTMEREPDWRRYPPHLWRDVPPGETEERVTGASTDEWPHVRLFFTDAGGRDWYRDPYGRLRRKRHSQVGHEGPTIRQRLNWVADRRRTIELRGGEPLWRRMLRIRFWRRVIRPSYLRRLFGGRSN